MRVCLVYDCLYPWTIGGAERWYRALAEKLAAEGHAVTYLTLRQWPPAAPPAIPGAAVVSVGPPLSLYAGGRRRCWPPLRFGLGVLLHLLRHGRAYDVVHTAAFPYFSALAAALARPLGGYALLVDWWEVWTDAYWRDYLGPIGGRLGALVQRVCACLPQRAVCFSRLHAGRLAQLARTSRHCGAALTPRPPLPRRGRGGVRTAAGQRPDIPGTIVSPSPPPGERGPGGEGWSTEPRGLGITTALLLIRGVYPGTPPAPELARPDPAAPEVLFVGRLVPDKRPAAIPPAIALARRDLPALRATMIGDGPERARVAALVSDLSLAEAIDLPGFVAEDTLDAALRQALCLVLPSRREGFGLAVLDAVSRGTPAVVVRDPDSAATELIEPGVNGVVAASADPAVLAAAILAVAAAGPRLRRSTRHWWERHRHELASEAGLAAVLAAYDEALVIRRPPDAGREQAARERRAPILASLYGAFRRPAGRHDSPW